MDRNSDGSLEPQEREVESLHNLGSIFSSQDMEGGTPGQSLPAPQSFNEAQVGIANRLEQSRILYICVPSHDGPGAQEAELLARQRAREGANAVFALIATCEPLKKKERIGAGTLLTLKMNTKTRQETRFLARAAMARRLLFRLWPHMRGAGEIAFTVKPPIIVRLLILISGKRYRLLEGDLGEAATV